MDKAKVIKQFSNLFLHFLHKNINSCLTEGIFLTILKRQWFIQPIKKNARLKNLNIDQSACCRISAKYTKDSYMTHNVYLI